jgi:squalene-associated FAD-dependent desaturase
VTPPHYDVIVVGAGCAGLSAAVALSEAGARVLVLEARPLLGGRATTFVDPATGESVDNGQHLLLGCYRETFTFLSRIGATDQVRLQPRLEVPFVDDAGVESLLSCPSLPAPLHLLAGLIDWTALGWADRWSAVSLVPAIRAARRYVRTGRGYLPASEEETVENWLIRNGQSRRLRAMLWEPLALAALNQPIREAAAPPFVRVLAEMFGPDPRASAIAVPLRPLAALYAEPSRALIRARGGDVRVASPARVRAPGSRVAGVLVRGEPIDAPSVVAAVPWFALPETVGDAAGALAPVVAAARAVAASPIVTVNLWLDRPVLPAPFVGLPGRTFQWVFDKRQVLGASASHLSLVSSGAAGVVARTNADLGELARAELTRAVPVVQQAHVRRCVVVRERRATFSLAPGQPPRPGARTPVEGLVLAGDWTDTGLPATIEGAVLSGHRAASAILGEGAAAPPRRW